MTRRVNGLEKLTKEILAAVGAWEDHHGQPFYYGVGKRESRCISVFIRSHGIYLMHRTPGMWTSCVGRRRRTSKRGTCFEGPARRSRTVRERHPMAVAATAVAA